MANPIFQSSYSHRPSEATVGQLASAFAPYNITAKIARGLIKAGYAVFKTTANGGSHDSMLDPGECVHIPNPGVAVNTTAILATGGTSATGTVSGAALNGVVGVTEMQPPRKVTIIFDASTDWDPTTGTFSFYNDQGALVTENVSIATSTTHTTTAFVSRVVSFAKPAQSGAGGTFTMGIAALAAASITDFLGVAIRKPIKTTIATAGIYGYPGITSTSVTADFIDGETVSVLEGGDIWVYAEEAIADGDPVYVRVASGAGGSVLGAFRNDADTASCLLVPGARFRRKSSAAGPAKARFPLYGF